MTPAELATRCEEVRSAATCEPTKFAKRILVWAAAEGFAVEIRPGEYEITLAGRQVVREMLGRAA